MKVRVRVVVDLNVAPDATVQNLLVDRGLSLIVEAHNTRLLLDSCSEQPTFLHNLAALAIPLESINLGVLFFY